MPEHPLVDIAARAAAEAHGRNWDTMMEIGRGWWRVEQRAALRAALVALRDRANNSKRWQAGAYLDDALSDLDAEARNA